jgi:hypothetical protein
VKQLARVLAFGSAVGVTVLLAACAGQKLAGRWEVRWLDGRRETVTLQDFGGGQWYLRGATDELNGVYEWKDSNLTAVKSDLPTMMGFSWKRGTDGTFTLVEQPEVSRLHDHWLGAKMVHLDTK